MWPYIHLHIYLGMIVMYKHPWTCTLKLIVLSTTISWLASFLFSTLEISRYDNQFIHTPFHSIMTTSWWIYDSSERRDVSIILVLNFFERWGHPKSLTFAYTHTIWAYDFHWVILGHLATKFYISHIFRSLFVCFWNKPFSSSMIS
jgi:hypothetical protein